MKVLYDLDGIICPDYKGSLLEVLTYRKNALLAYNPSGRFSILTGRPIEDTADTLFWLIRNNVRFDTLYHRNTDPFHPELYKLAVLQTLKEPYLFYESDPEQVAFLTQRGINATLFQRK